MHACICVRTNNTSPDAVDKKHQYPRQAVGTEAHIMRMRDGFTLIELLVVIAIIAILAAILFPMFVIAKESAKRSACTSNLKQLGLALQNYADSYNGFYPPARVEYHWPWGDWNDDNPVYGSGYLGLRAVEPYVKNKHVFFCPSNAFFKSPPYWTNKYSYWAGYSYWGNYVGYYGLTREQIAVNVGQYPYSLLMSDIVVTTLTGGPHPFNSHPPKGIPTGGAYLYNDGHVKWKWRSQMRVLTSKSDVTFYW
jgi:prepilin-type N-terminal cleavage/methylation domain-containing protein